ncbi:cupin domain-containing protein [Geomesophilobacter sediminis]|uniref:Cupin domain-containing protein n=1 Tax=Geomesophilobacter sediminis TaxID=2798584 RepID=A0A8J7LVZ4_9BACT|nr:cupin domain-containing protein [Geomesophilobacter sediminis]MBJ6725380.1 cupin domain-containing protein [Geomesophilobacter sediminis]
MAKKGVAKAEVLKLIDQAAYQEGAVVSRTIIDEPVGTVTAFAFAEGEGLSEHTVPYDAMVQVLDGEAQITIDGVPNTVKAGEMIIMPSHKPHKVRALKQFKMLLVMIRS